MGFITPNAGLILTAVIVGFFSIAMTIAPGWIMGQYGVDSSGWTQTEKMMTVGFFQFIGLNYGLVVAACNVTFRNGTDDQKSMLCAVTGAAFIIMAIVSFAAIGSWTDLGTPAAGGYFNGVLCLVVAIVNLLGYSKAEIKLVNLKAPIFWGFLASIVINVLYMVGFAFAAESLCKSYGVELTGNAKGVLENAMKFTYAPILLYVTGIFALQICVQGPLSTYVYARYVGFFDMALALVYLVCAVIWTNLDAQPAQGLTASAKDKIVSGQYFNAALYFLLFVLFYVAVVRLDSSLKETVEKELAAPPAKKSKKKSAAAEPAAAPAAAGEPVVEPLLPPPRPLMPLASSSTLIPSYSMVAAPQMAYGSQPQYYAAPATTAYAAPATTAYATPMPQYTYATAAPATAGYAPVATTAYAAPVTVATTA